MSREQPSKSMRVQEYMRANPQTRNCDVVKALAEYGVTAADVSNAKTQLKKKVSRRRSRASVTAAVAATPGGDVPASDTNNTISIDELEAAIEYVQAVGGLSRAIQLLAVVQQIRTL